MGANVIGVILEGVYKQGVASDLVIVFKQASFTPIK
jgi:hypothetical protein